MTRQCFVHSRARGKSVTSDYLSSPTATVQANWHVVPFEVCFVNEEYPVAKKELSTAP
jgi:hypothetical protein